MTSHASAHLSCILAGMLLTAATDVAAQGRRGPGGPSPQPAAPLPVDPLTGRLPADPLAGPNVTNAPYSGNAVTTVTQILGDGTRIEQKTEARFYRDSAGRIRREQAILGLPAQTPFAQAQKVVTIDSTPDDMFAYTLDPVARTARRVSLAKGAIRWRVGGGDLTVGNYFGVVQGFVVPQFIPQPGTPVGARLAEESLGARQIEGVRATGRKTTNTIPTGQIGNDRPIEITDERWESPDLKLLVYSRFSDPRTGVVEYKLLNINRAEPPADLFAVPADYTMLEPGAGGVRGGLGVPGGRGPQ